MTFIDKQTTTSNYLIKEYNTTLPIDIKTTKLNLQNNKIEIDYEVVDTKTKYNYKIEFE